MFRFYEVGGKVRDEILGVKSNDIDYTVVPDEHLIYSGLDIGVIFNKLVDELKLRGFEIFLVTPDCFTIRARWPIGSTYSGVADFVLARKEIGYKEGTRSPIVVPGSLLDDLQRRDFTCNAVAKDSNGNYIDPFNGIKDIQARILRTPIKGQVTFEDDPLRILRALRFSVTKGFRITNKLQTIIKNFDYTNKFGVVSEERIREELFKMLKHDTKESLNMLGYYHELSDYIFNNTKLWFKPTNES